MFPLGWHRAILEGLGTKVASVYHTEVAARRAVKRWRLFTYSLRNFPLHPTSIAYAANVHRLFVRYSQVSEMWELQLVTKTHLEKEFENLADVLDKAD